MEEVSLAWHMKALNSYCSEDRREKLNRQLSVENGESYSQVLGADWTVFTGRLFTKPVNKILQCETAENIFPFACIFIAPIYMLLVPLLKKRRKKVSAYFESEAPENWILVITALEMPKTKTNLKLKSSKFLEHQGLFQSKTRNKPEVSLCRT